MCSGSNAENIISSLSSSWVMFQEVMLDQCFRAQELSAAVASMKAAALLGWSFVPEAVLTHNQKGSLSFIWHLGPPAWELWINEPPEFVSFLQGPGYPPGSQCKELGKMALLSLAISKGVIKSLHRYFPNWFIWSACTVFQALFSSVGLFLILHRSKVMSWKLSVIPVL